jgi:predicted small secreted protein
MPRFLNRPAFRLAGALVGIAFVAMIAACKTTEGAGKDLENLGENVQDSAEKHSP